MKTKIFFFGFLVSLVYLTACDQNSIDNIGSSVQPDGNRIVAFDTTFFVIGRTVKVDSVYAKSINGLLGSFLDPDYGKIETGYICQYYPADPFELDSMVNKNEIDSIRLFILYQNFTGDSLSPMQATVYPVKKGVLLDNLSRYSNIDPTQYSDMNRILGSQAYTARNLNVSDSANSSTASYKVLSMPLPLELGYEFLEECKKSDLGAFASPEAMRKFFPGTYIASTFGSGNLLHVEGTRIHIYYKRHYKDSIVTSYAALNVTKEVVQLNHIVTSENNHLWENQSSDEMYIKTPAGVFSKITIPLKEITNSIGNRRFSRISLSLEALPKANRPFTLNFPGLGIYNSRTMTSSKLLLIEPDSLKSFFENQRIADNQTSYFTTLSPSTSTYNYENISNVVQNAINKNPNAETLDLLLVPADVSYYTSTSYPYSNIDKSPVNYLMPSAVTLSTKDLKIRVIAVDRDVNQ